MISVMLLIVSVYVFSRSVEKTMEKKGSPAIWIVTAIVAVFCILYSLLGGSPTK